jgi:hypothetical protein
MRRLGMLCLAASVAIAVLALALPAGAGGRPFFAAMTGANEFPGPGIPTAQGPPRSR